jgi:uncharacterized protein (DUF885 family)
MSSVPIPRRRALQLAAAAGALAASPFALAAAPTPPQRLARLGTTWFHERNTLFPVDATESHGDPRYEGLLAVDIAPAHRARQQRLHERTLAALRAIDPAGLDETERLSHALLRHESEDALALLAHPQHLMPVLPMDSLPVRLARWADGRHAQPLKTVANYRHFLARLQGLPAWIAQAIANMEQGLAQGVVLPRPLVERTLPQIESLLPADPAQSPYLAGVRAFPDTIGAQERERLAAAYRRTVDSALAPALRRLRDFLRDTYLPRARDTAGLNALPGGDAWYRALVRSYTTTAQTAQEIHQTGLKEVQRIRAEMEQVKARFGFEGPLNAFLQSLDTRAELMPFTTEEEVLAAYRALNEKVKAGLPALFERAPRAALEIRAVDAISRDTASDNYVPPAADGSRPGTYYTVILDPKRYRTTRMAALFLHEGQPGHHYQMGLQQELALPSFRRALWYTAHGEGWGLYAEGLGRELGVYDQPDAWLGRLLLELHRALRLVIDTGLHDQGWSRERAIAFLREHEGTSEAQARRAAERYMTWPGQALAYKIGELKLLELRERAKARLGARFDIRRFHSVVLDAGTLPLALLEARVDGWIARQL